MSMSVGVEALATAVAETFNDVRAELAASKTMLVLGPADPVPGGTPVGTVILRTD